MLKATEPRMNKDTRKTIVCFLTGLLLAGSLTLTSCLQEEEKQKQNLEFIAPEVKVVEISGQTRLCQSSTRAEATGSKVYDLNDLDAYDGLDAYDRHAL